jgi:diadenosine tetraphosphatase ApaH/serine/threonine PP2A family protein phosphatase
MRYLVISDLHGNLEALDATLASAEPTDAILVLGDLIGYGADPNAVVERVRTLPDCTAIRGNHDKVGVGIDDVKAFNHLARRAIEWTAAELTSDNRDWVAALPQGPLTVDALVQICHGAPFDEDVYIFDDLDAGRAMRAVTSQVCLFGHTHVPAVFAFDTELRVMGPPRGPRFELQIEDGQTYLVNCGAVGQPRDGDPRAAHGILDTVTRTLTVTRVTYDLAKAQAKILAAGLPAVLAQRLAAGR